MSALVLGAAVFAFSPRPLPAFPVTAIHADRLQMGSSQKTENKAR